MKGLVRLIDAAAVKAPPSKMHAAENSLTKGGRPLSEGKSDESITSFFTKLDVHNQVLHFRPTSDQGLSS